MLLSIRILVVPTQCRYLVLRKSCNSKYEVICFGQFYRADRVLVVFFWGGGIFYSKRSLCEWNFDTMSFAEIKLVLESENCVPGVGELQTCPRSCYLRL